MRSPATPVDNDLWTTHRSNKGVVTHTKDGCPKKTERHHKMTDSPKKDRRSQPHQRGEPPSSTTTAPVRSVSGAPVTERAARIAEAVAGLEETYLRVRSEIASGDPSHGLDGDALHGIIAEIARLSDRYDYYNWP